MVVSKVLAIERVGKASEQVRKRFLEISTKASNTPVPLKRNTNSLNLLCDFLDHRSLHHPFRLCPFSPLAFAFLPSLQLHLRKLHLLLRSGHGLRIPQSILVIELDVYGVVVRSAVQAAGFHARYVGHDFELGVEGGAAGWAELDKRALASHASAASEANGKDGRDFREGILGRGCEGRWVMGSFYPVFIHFPTGTLGVVGFWLAFGDVEGRARDDDVGGVGCSGPFLRERALASVSEQG